MAVDRVAEFNRVFDLCRDPVQRYCLRRMPSDEVNDAVAEVFLIAWKKLDSHPGTLELPYLYGIARNVVRNADRARRRRAGLRAAIASQPVTEAPGPENQVLTRHEDRAILEALEKLRPDDREVLRLKAWEQLSNAAIADALDISVGAVEMRISRARARLAVVLDRTRHSDDPQRVRQMQKKGDR